MASFTFITERPPNPPQAFVSPPSSPGAGAGGGTLGDHLADADPHPQYLTQTEGDSRYSQLGHTHTASQITDFSEAVDDRVAALASAGAGLSISYNDAGNVLTFTNTDTGSAAVTTHLAAVDPHPQYTTAAEVATAISGLVTSVTGTTGEITATGTTSVVLSIPSAITLTGKTVTGGTFNAAGVSSTSGALNGTLGATTKNTAAVTSLVVGAAVVGSVPVNSQQTGAAAANMVLWNDTDSKRMALVTGTAGVEVQSANDDLSLNALDGGKHLLLKTQSTTRVDISSTLATFSPTTVFGHTASVTGAAGVVSKVQVHSAFNNQAGMFAWSATNGTRLEFGRSASGTIGTHAALASGDFIGSFSATGSDGTSFFPTSSIQYYVGGAVSAGVVPGRILTAITDTAGVGKGVLDQYAASTSILTDGVARVNVTTATTTVTNNLGVTGVILGSAGSVSNASHSFTADPNTGMNNPTADNIGFVTGGVEAARISAAGRLLIGDTNQGFGSACALQVHNDGGTYQGTRYSNTSGGDVFVVGHTRSTTKGTVGVTLINGDDLGTIRFQGDDGTDVNTIGGRVRVRLNAAPTTNRLTGRLDIGLASGAADDNITEVAAFTVASGCDVLSGDYLRGGTKVVGARATGWTAATGTATRSTFATSTVTLPLLAERVKALIDDLIAHGLIGT